MNMSSMDRTENEIHNVEIADAGAAARARVPGVRSCSRRARRGRRRTTCRQLEDEYKQKRATYDASHPDLISLRRQIDMLRAGGSTDGHVAAAAAAAAALHPRGSAPALRRGSSGHQAHPAQHRVAGSAHRVGRIGRSQRWRRTRRWPCSCRRSSTPPTRRSRALQARGARAAQEDDRARSSHDRGAAGGARIPDRDARPRERTRRSTRSCSSGRWMPKSARRPSPAAPPTSSASSPSPSTTGQTGQAAAHRDLRHRASRWR